jgi:hypothetical protein
VQQPLEPCPSPEDQSAGDDRRLRVAPGHIRPELRRGLESPPFASRRTIAARGSPTRQDEPRCHLNELRDSLRREAMSIRPSS